MKRTIGTALLTFVALATVLVAYAVTGLQGLARERDAGLREAKAGVDARERAAAARLTAALDALRTREDDRPYFQYQSLYHDPRGASSGPSVVPSPLSQEPGDPLIATHFQIDPRGVASVPTLNDEFPALSTTRHRDEAVRYLAALRAEVAHLALPTLPAATTVEVAVAEARPARASRPAAAVQVPTPPRASAPAAVATNVPAAPTTEPKGAATPSAAVAQGQQVAVAGSAPATNPDDDAQLGVVVAPLGRRAAQVENYYSPSAYAQNAAPNAVYGDLAQQRAAPKPAGSPPRTAQQQIQQQRAAQQRAAQQALPAPRPQQAPQPAAPPQAADLPAQAAATQPQAAIEPQAEAQSTETPPKPLRRPRRRAAAPAPPTIPGVPEAEVRVTVEGFDFRPFTLGGEAGALALRRVETPDGTLTQGFFVPEARLAAVAGEAGPLALLPSAPAAPGAAPCAAYVAPIDRCVQGGASAAQAAALAAAETRRAAFIGRLVPVSALALLAGLLVVVVAGRTERLARQRSAFAAAAAHELRTPLAGLQLYGEMLADGLGDPARSRDYARRVADEAARLGRVVGNVLGFTQLERGTLAVQPRVGDLAEAVAEAVARALGPLEHAGVALTVRGADAPAFARFDRDAIARIVQNLLDNAEKYGRGSRDRRVEVQVEAAVDVVRVRVIDHGPGVAARTRLFQPFSRGDAATPSGDHPAGLGLGLVLARTLAEAQGGGLAHEATPGGGATFVLTLPAAAADLT